VAGIPSVSFFGGALLSSVLLLPEGFHRFLFFLGGLAGFVMWIGSSGTDLWLAGSGGRMTRELLFLDGGVCSCRLLVRCLNRV
jgi:hypothetical protein